MSKIIAIKLTKIGTNSGPFDIHDEFGNLIEGAVPIDRLSIGVSYTVDDSVFFITLTSIEGCISSVTKSVVDITESEYLTPTEPATVISCLWTHLVDHTIFNSYYGTIQPYIIEYPFAYTLSDEIVQNVSDYNKVFKYLDTYLNVSDKNAKIQIDGEWFNKAILYNGQQSTGILELNTKPVNNMKEYLSYPKFNADSKSIIWSKSDNMYEYNTFWSLVKDKSSPLFLTSCESLSIDKVVNQENMDYSIRAYRKATLRAKDLKVRHILDDKSDISIVTQFILTPSQISYK